MVFCLSNRDVQDKYVKKNVYWYIVMVTCCRSNADYDGITRKMVIAMVLAQISMKMAMTRTTMMIMMIKFDVS